MAYNGVYVAKNVEEINKYNPGLCKFAIPSLMDTTGSEEPMIKETTNTTSNIVNKEKSAIQATTTQTSNYININVPIEHTIYYPTKIIPKGTVFFVMFVGGSMSRPIIVGRDIYGYY